MKIAVGSFSIDLDLGGSFDPQPVFSQIAEMMQAMAVGIAADVAAIAAASTDVEPLLTSAAGRAAADAADQAQARLSDTLIQAALADLALARAIELVGPTVIARVQSGDAVTWIGASAAALSLGQARPPLACDLAQGLTGNGKRAVALDGKRSISPQGPFADTVAVLSGSAVRARASAAAISAAIPAPTADGAKALAPEVIWDALGQGARIAQRLRSKQLIETAALTAKGRGRTIGTLKADLLVRFGVSEWR